MKIFPKERINSLLQEIFSLNKEEYLFSLVGGEPSIYPHIEYFYEKLVKQSKNNTKITMYTNGSRLAFLEQTIQKIFTYTIHENQKIHLQFIITLHLEQKSFEDYYMTLKQFGYPELCTIKILMQPNKMAETLEYKTKLKELGYKMEIDPIGLYGKMHPDYTEQELVFLKSQDNFMQFFNTYKNDNNTTTEYFNFFDYFVYPEKISYKGLQCTAGKNFIRIMPDGIVTFCHKDWTKSNFSILKQSLHNYPYLNKTVTCQSDRCACPETVALPKWRE